MAFDKAEWQYDSALKFYCKKYGKNPDDLTEEEEELLWDYSGNHIAIFLTWLIRHDFLGEFHHEDELEEQELEEVKQQKKTGMDIFKKYCDMCFTNEDVSDEILPFVEKYYDNYLSDYGKVMDEDKILATAFDWDDYFKVEKVIDKAYEETV